MQNLIFGWIEAIGSLLKKLPIKQFLPIVLVGLMLSTTNVDPDLASSKTVDRINKIVGQENPDRPKTTGQWQQQARETKNDPGERIKRIGEQSADAVKEFGSMYPQVAKKSAAELDRNTK